jgi:DNA mismatch repair ATPase MutS
MLCRFGEVDGVENFHMGYKVDEQTNDVTFLYQLRRGACSNSFGIQVAKLAGLPMKVLKIAEGKSKEFSEKLKVFEVALKDIN